MMAWLVPSLPLFIAKVQQNSEISKYLLHKMLYNPKNIVIFAMCNKYN